MHYQRTINAYRAHRRMADLLSFGVIGLGTRSLARIATMPSKPRMERVNVVRSVDGSIFGYADIPSEWIRD